MKPRLSVAALAFVAACYAEAGSIVAPWPRADVQLVADDMGITPVLAQSDEDALFGAGYAMTRDRATQMELYRRQALGRSAEILGPSSVPADLGARVLDFARLGAQDEARTRAERPDDATLVDAWVAGVNARLSELRAAGTPPCGLSFVPDDWTAAHAYAIGKLLAYGLSNTVDAEILATALQRLAPSFVSQVPILLPAYDVFTMGASPSAGAPAPPPPRTTSGRPTGPGPVPSFAPFLFPGGHSNNWAVDEVDPILRTTEAGG